MYVKLKDNFKKGKYGDEGGVLYMNDNEQQIYDQVSQKRGLSRSNDYQSKIV